MADLASNAERKVHGTMKQALEHYVEHNHATAHKLGWHDRRKEIKRKKSSRGLAADIEMTTVDLAMISDDDEDDQYGEMGGTSSGANSAGGSSVQREDDDGLQDEFDETPLGKKQRNERRVLQHTRLFKPLQAGSIVTICNELTVRPKGEEGIFLFVSMMIPRNPSYSFLSTCFC